MNTTPFLLLSASLFLAISLLSCSSEDSDSEFNAAARDYCAFEYDGSCRAGYTAAECLRNGGIPRYGNDCPRTSQQNNNTSVYCQYNNNNSCEYMTRYECSNYYGGSEVSSCQNNNPNVYCLYGSYCDEMTRNNCYYQGEEVSSCQYYNTSVNCLYGSSCSQMTRRQCSYSYSGNEVTSSCQHYNTYVNCQQSNSCNQRTRAECSYYGGSEVTSCNVLVDNRDGKSYKTVNINGRTWMAENLNGDYGNNTCYACSVYGRLYDWETAMSACPYGWRIPSYYEWEDLYASSSFAALPGGYGISYDYFEEVGDYGYWWSSTEDGYSHAYSKLIGYNSGDTGMSTHDKYYFLSVRCLKDF